MASRAKYNYVQENTSLLRPARLSRGFRPDAGESPFSFRGRTFQISDATPPGPGDAIQFPIHDIAFGGKGVGRAEGLAIFVPFVITGEQVTARLTRRKKKFAEAELLSVDEPSPDRVEPRLPLLRRMRRLRLPAHPLRPPARDQIRPGRANPPPPRPLRRRPHAPAPSPRRANTATATASASTPRAPPSASTGIDRHELIDIAECPIATPAVNDQLAALRRSLTRPGRDGDYLLTGQGRGDYFVQTNDAVAAALLDHVRALVSPASRTLVDAYSGAGFFARGLASRFTQVIGIEENERAVEYARRIAGAQ